MRSGTVKSVTAWMSALKNALSGGYVNFGVFQLYGDAALPNAQHALISLVLALRPAEIAVRR